ncbi:hypothetical protein [Streptomyces alfalfae]
MCWAATAALLLVALPADVDGVPGGPLIGYGALLLSAAAHGAYRAARDRRPWPLRAPLAAALAVALLAVPAGGVFAYESARDEAVEEMLLERLRTADRIVAGLKGEPFDGGTTEARYKKALGIYRGLAADHPGSEAADRLPASLKTYYESVASPYAAKRYCDAVAPLQHLRTVPATYGKDRLGALAAWPETTASPPRSTSAASRASAARRARTPSARCSAPFPTPARPARSGPPSARPSRAARPRSRAPPPAPPSTNCAPSAPPRTPCPPGRSTARPCAGPPTGPCGEASTPAGSTSSRTAASPRPPRP